MTPDPKVKHAAGGYFDAIVVGTSPLLLIEALYLESQGQRVALAEQRDRPGGAWYTIPLWDYSSVEVGCHYLERGRSGYRFLSEFLGIKLQPYTVKCVWMNTDEIPDDKPYLDRVAGIVLRKILWGRFLSDDLWGVIKSIDRRDPFKFGRALRRMIASPPYRYPVGGSRVLIEALAQRVAASSIEYFGKSRVTDIVVDSDDRPIRCRIDGRERATKSLVVGQHAYPKLLTGDQQREDAEALYTINVLLKIDGRKAISFDYFEIHRNDLINRVADVTSFAQPSPLPGRANPEMLVCCNLTQETGKDSPVDGPAIFDHLVGLGLLEKGASLVAAHVERYPVPETTDCEPPDSIRVLRTYDLGVELERHAERWKPLLPR